MKNHLSSHIIILSIIFCGIVTVWGQPPENHPDSLKELRDMPIKRTPRGLNDYVRYCAFCHGGNGKGDGLNAFNISTRPRDFTDTIAMRGRTPVSIQKVIQNGGASNNLSNDMPPWGATLDSQSIAGLTEYIRLFGRAASGMTTGK